MNSPPPPLKKEPAKETKPKLILELSVPQGEDYYSDNTKTKVLANEARECVRRLNEIHERLSNRGVNLDVEKSGYGSLASFKISVTKQVEL